MNEPPRCTKCGAVLPNDAPAGLCPKCLVQAGFESEVAPQPSQAGNDPAVRPTRKSPASAAAGFEPPSPEELAPLFPQLEILELLGKGGMGAVYKARQRGLDRLVAVKILPPEIGHDAAFAERFTREARALARLSHPHIVAVYDFGQTSTPLALLGRGAGGEGSLFYIVMEYVDGANLRQAIQAGGLAPQHALAIVPQICEALQFAHDEGIVHRDIKPENILIDKRGRVKIADFGLAKLVGQDAPDHFLTGTHQVMGTLRYMAPEQMQGSREVDHRADIYSLGVVFYELLTGELPMGKFAPPSKKVQVDVRLDEIVLRALEQEPEQRYQHASEVKTDVEGGASLADASNWPRRGSRIVK
jgi:serine/threonine protein kinase